MSNDSTRVPVPDKKRKLNSDDVASNSLSGRDGKNNKGHGPIVFLNVGGAKRNVRRSLLNDLRCASHAAITTTAACESNDKMI